MRHLLDIDALSVHDIEHLLNRAAYFEDGLKDKSQRLHTILEDKLIIVVFAEHSTRTKVSFEVAAARLGARTIEWDKRTSSMSKGESFSDTIAYLGSYAPDCIVIRHNEFNAAHYVSTQVNCPVINAGDGWNQHPTQALLDAYTLIKHKGTLNGLTVAICGDIAHSRVANSNMSLLTKMGATVHLVAPPLLKPEKIKYPNVKIFETLEDGLPSCDAVMMLRLQKERMDQALIPNDYSYFKTHGLTVERLALAKPDAIVMHPGPMNRNVEIADDVADDKTRSVIFEQGANSVPVRMAILEWVMAAV